MVSSETTKLAIIRRNRYPSKPPIIPYQDAKGWLVRAWTDPQNKRRILEDAIEHFEYVADDDSVKPLKRNDARLSIDAIRAFRDSLIDFQSNRLTFVPAPRNLSPLVLEGVHVKANFDLISHATIKNKDYEGGIIFRLTKAEEDSILAKHRREEMGHYAATIAFMQVADKTPTGREARNDITYAIDVRCGQAFSARGGTRRMSNLKAACRMISSIWASI